MGSRQTYSKLFSVENCSLPYSLFSLALALITSSSKKMVPFVLITASVLSKTSNDNPVLQLNQFFACLRLKVTFPA